MAQQLLKSDDGFFVGRVLKNGNLSKDAYHLSRNEIIKMFSEILEDYCLRYQQPMEVERNGKPYIRATLII